MFYDLFFYFAILCIVPRFSRSIAVHKTWRDRDTGEWKQGEKATWLNIAMFGDKAEEACKTLGKGSFVEIHGEMSTKNWTDKNDQKRTAVSVVCNKMVLKTKKVEDNGSEDK